ncbi:MAG: group 1 truncated hemoglobin [Luteimonas sp.]|nr:group 1 truncated hemoglobin [Luteimonas sp.]
MRMSRVSKAIAIAAAILLSAGCATPGARDRTPYEQMGGADGVAGIVDDLLQKILEDDRINFQFAQADIMRFREKLIEQVCVESGGPCTYTGQTMQESHAGRHIDDVQFNALVEDLTNVMEARKVPIGAQNRLLKNLAAMHGDIVEP